MIELLLRMIQNSVEGLTLRNPPQSIEWEFWVPWDMTPLSTIKVITDDGDKIAFTISQKELFRAPTRSSL